MHRRIALRLSLPHSRSPLGRARPMPGHGPCRQGAIPGPLSAVPATTGGTLDISRRAGRRRTRRASSPSSTTAARASCIRTSAARRRRAASPSTECRTRSSTARSRSRRCTFDYWDESDGVNYGDRAGRAVLSDSGAGDHAAALGRRRRARQRRPAQRQRPPSADHRLHATGISTSSTTSGTTRAAKWYAGSGAFFDMNTNNRRPDTWTSADAAGLAIFPGLVRYDEAWNPAITDIGHAFRVTVRATNGYVYPASHRAGSTTGALPMGARLRLKTNVSGADPALRTERSQRAQDLPRDAEVRPHRRRQRLGHVHHRHVRHALEQRRPESRVRALSASDFEVVQLGWKPTRGDAACACDPARLGVAAVVGGAVAHGHGHVVGSGAGRRPHGGVAEQHDARGRAGERHRSRRDRQACRSRSRRARRGATRPRRSRDLLQASPRPRTCASTGRRSIVPGRPRRRWNG